MRIRLAVTFDIHRDPKPVLWPDTPETPAIYDVSSAQIERADQWDHERRQPIGFTKWV